MTHYRATFSDGEVREIANSKRFYSVGWKAHCQRPDGSRDGFSGFARDAALARRSGASETSALRRRGGHLLRVEIVPVEVVP